MPWKLVGSLGASLALVTISCGDDTTGSGGAGGNAPPPEIAFSAMGSLTSDTGKGSFRFGASTAATQIEDQNEDTDWWAYTLPEEEGGLGKGDAPVGDASMGYSMSEEDIQLLVELGVDSYRFSVEWARIEPERDVIDEAAIAHYSDQLDALIAAGIRPMITVHHFSNPIWVMDPREDCAAGPTDENLCGYGHPEGGPLIIEEIRQHAGLLAERFGDRVDEWGTVNEPVNYLLASYGIGSFPPGKSTILAEETLFGEFIPVVIDYLKMHAAMYDAIKQNDTVDADGDGSNADVGFTLSVGAFVPSRNNAVSEEPDDIAAAERVRYIYHYLFVESVLNGTFDSDLDGEPDMDIPEIAGTVDWLGVQYYFRGGVTAFNAVVPVLNVTPCFASIDLGACLPPVDGDKTKCVPAMKYEYYEPGLYEVLADFSQRWPDLPMVVTESGIATETGKRRAEHVVRSLEQIDRAIQEGVDVRGYYHWSLYDNFEWVDGFQPRFGLYTVDYQSFTRTATEGATTLSEIASSRKISSAQRGELGGTGPMTEEAGAMVFDRCNQ